MKQHDPMDEDVLEAEEGLDPSSTDVYPDVTVKISRDQYSAFEIKRMAEETKELMIAPPFQRKLVWNSEQKRELIESILMGIPLPVIYVFEDENGYKQVVDGRQRISTIISFMNNEFKLEKLKMLPSFNGKRFKDIKPLYRSKIERYQIPVYVIEPPTPERVKYDIFDRVNRGGTQLNNQEMRNALYSGESTKLLEQLSESNIFKQATNNGIKPKRMKDQYVILRFLAFYLLKTGKLQLHYKSNIDDLLAETMKQINKMQPEKITILKDVFIKAMQSSNKIMGPDAFRFSQKKINRRPVNMALFEALTFFFTQVDIDEIPAKLIQKKIEKLKIEFDDSGYFSSRVDSTTSVDYRFDAVSKLARELQC